MFNDMHGLTRERRARLTYLAEQCQPLAAREDGMELVQQFLRDQGASVIDSIAVTRELLGAGPGSLGEAKGIVLTSASRVTELHEHQRFVEQVEQGF
ncbi:hypothetical protein ACFXBB_23645 [Streptomyces scopuliridis]|uniref:hypothetical protein n=1 Tax=Streptomyces scopuliridis TaxID=452529 RepID=UPI0036B91B1E